MELNLIGCLACDFVARKRSNKGIGKIKESYKFCPKCGEKLQAINDLSVIKEKKVFVVNWVKIIFSGRVRKNVFYSKSYHIDEGDVFLFCSNFHFTNFGFRTTRSKIIKALPETLRIEIITDEKLYLKVLNSKDGFLQRTFKIDK